MKQYEALPSPEDIKETNQYMKLAIPELKKLMMLYHPDTGKSPDYEKFEQIRYALQYKKSQKSESGDEI